MRAFKINEISAVDNPAQEGATISIMKRATPAVTKAVEVEIEIDGGATNETPTEPDMTPEEKIAELEAMLSAANEKLAGYEAKAAPDAPAPDAAPAADAAESAPAMEVEVEAEAKGDCAPDMTMGKSDVVFTADDGTEYTKAADPALVKMARERDIDRKALREEIAKRRHMEFAKRAADELGHLPGVEGHKVALLAAIEGIDDDVTRKGIGAMLRANDAGLAAALVKRGTTGGVAVVGGTAEAQLDAMAKSLVADKKATDYAKAYDMALRSPEGRAIYGQIKTPTATPAPLA